MSVLSFFRKMFGRLSLAPVEAAFDYDTLVGKLREKLDDYAKHHPAIPNDVRPGIYRPLWEQEGPYVLQAISWTLNEKARELDGKQGFSVPNRILIKADIFERKKGDGFLDNIDVQFCASSNTFDPDEGTRTIQDSSLAPRMLNIALPTGCCLEQTDEDEFLLTFLWKSASRFKPAARHLELVGNSSGTDIRIDGLLCTGMNTLSGPNGGHPSDGLNRIRISLDELPLDFASIEVKDDGSASVSLTDKHVSVYLDGTPLQYGRAFAFSVGKDLNLGGLCTLRLL